MAVRTTFTFPCGATLGHDGPNEFPLTKLGRARIAVADWETKPRRPTLPSGFPAPCQGACPHPRIRRRTRALSSDESHANRVVTTCLGTHSEAPVADGEVTVGEGRT